MTKFAKDIVYSIALAEKLPKIANDSFRGHVLQAVVDLTTKATDGMAGLSDIHESAMQFVWTDGKSRDESDVFRLVQDVMHSVGDTTSSASGWLHKEGGRRIGTGTGGRLGMRKYDPVILPAGKFVFISDTADVTTAILVDPRPLSTDSELRYKIQDVEDIKPDFMAWLKSLKGANHSVKMAIFETSMSLDAKDRNAAIMGWHRDGRTVASARTAFAIIV